MRRVRRVPLLVSLLLATTCITVASCDSADVGQHPDASSGDDGATASDAGSTDGDAAREGDSGPVDAGPRVLFEELFDDDDAATRWISITSPTDFVFADGVATSPVSCEAYAECDEGPAVAYTREVITVPDDARMTLEMDIVMQSNGEFAESSVLFSLGREGSIPHLDSPCGETVDRCWRGFEILVGIHVRFPSLITVNSNVIDGMMPIVRSYMPETNLREGIRYHVRVAMCGSNGVRTQVFDRGAPVVDARSTMNIQLPAAGWSRQNVYLEGQGEGHTIDDVRITEGADCD